MSRIGLLLMGSLWLVGGLWGNEEESFGGVNLWPFWVDRPADGAGRVEQWHALGPLVGGKEREKESVLSLRPVWTQFRRPGLLEDSGHILYPLANLYTRGEVRQGHVLNLARFYSNPESGRSSWELFPFLYRQNDPVKENRYFAFWPVGGELKNRFWRDRIQFAAWPLWVRTEKGDETWNHFPYPFLRVLDGPKSRGFGIWPFYGQSFREDDYAHRWALWPLIYHYKDNLDEAEPYIRFGVLPFYHRETGPGLRSESYLWPFFGYTEEGPPRRDYSEIRYFWPLLVQGEGEERRVNRWLPFFAHEREESYRKNWYLWPLWKEERFGGGLPRRERSTLLYFLYRDERQYLTAERTARMTTLWPFFGRWTDGAGRTQVQALDPLSVFFPNNRKVQENWSPLFALYRYDRREESRRHSLLWNLVVWENERFGGAKRFQLGPLLEWRGGPSGMQLTLLGGFLGFDGRGSDRGMDFLWMRW